MAINKVVYGNNVLVDLTEDTVSPENLQSGATAHSKSGALIRGTASMGGAAPCTVIAENEFNSNSIYDIGDHVLYQGGLYRFISTHTGAWNADHVVQVTVGSELTDIANDTGANGDIEIQKIFFGIRNGTNDWASVGVDHTVNYNWILKVKPGDKINFNSRSTRHVFLKSLNNMTIQGGAPYYCSGYSATIPNGTGWVCYTAPSDANYMFFAGNAGQWGDFTPSLIYKNNCDVFVSLADNFVNLSKRTPFLSTISLYANVSQAIIDKYGNLDTAPMNEMYIINRDGIPSCTNYPDRLYTGAKIITIGSLAHFPSSYGGAIQIAIGFEDLDAQTNMGTGIAWRTNAGSWNDWSYSIGEKNYLLSTTLTENSILDDYGIVVSKDNTQGFYVTDYIPVSFGDLVQMGRVQGYGLLRAAFIYDSDHNPLYAMGADRQYVSPAEFTVLDERAAYIRYNVVADRVFSVKRNYLHIIKNKEVPKVKDLYLFFPTTTFNTRAIYPVNFNKLKDVCEYIKTYNVWDATVHVYPGTYDLVSEYGMEYLDSISSDSNVGYGPKIGNNTHFLFYEGAKIVFNYTGSNEKVAELFSAFNVYESFTLENANIEVTNARYCVHEDVPTLDEHPWQYTAKYINCVMKHNGNTLQYNGTACIGAGTNRNSTSVIEGGKYTAVQFGAAIGYHNFNTASWGNYSSKVILHNVWINNSLRLSTMSTSEMDVEISGCYIPNGYQIAFDTNLIHVTQWNNIGLPSS